jgi:hypothetical protein
MKAIYQTHSSFGFGCHREHPKQKRMLLNVPRAASTTLDELKSADYGILKVYH